MPGRLETITIDSVALAANALRDPPRRRVPVWLPPSYDTSPERRFPVIYWLAGFAGSGESLFQSGGPWQPGLGERLDRLVGEGAMGEAIVVAPDCFTRLGGSQYLDSSATGQYETHLCGELVPVIDQAFRTIPFRTGRGIGGRSSGGFGALVLSMRHSDLFAAVASHAGDGYFELSVLRDIPIAARSLERHGGVRGFLSHFEGTPSRSSDDTLTMMMLALSAAYAPDPGAPHGFTLPFDLETGEILEVPWRRFKAWDPVDMVGLAAHAEALRDMRLVYLDAGTRDEWGLDLSTRILAARMRKVGIDVDHREFDDGHRGTAYRFEVSLPLISRALDPPTDLLQSPL